MLPVLKQAGVVDSGGRGFLEILYGMRAYLKGAPVESESKAETKESADFASFDPASIENPYCTECIITKNPEYTKEGSVEKLRKFVLSMGDSVVFAEDSEIVKIHVHTKDPGAILSKCREWGEFLTIKVENMTLQHHENHMETRFKRSRKAWERLPWPPAKASRKPSRKSGSSACAT
jgi:dihydroxyacetone kinase-like predicted kinase